jgi:hypothetical protein
LPLLGISAIVATHQVAFAPPTLPVKAPGSFDEPIVGFDLYAMPEKDMSVPAVPPVAAIVNVDGGEVNDPASDPPVATNPAQTSQAPVVTGVIAGGLGLPFPLPVAVVVVASNGLGRSTPRNTATLVDLVPVVLPFVLTKKLVEEVSESTKK